MFFTQGYWLFYTGGVKKHKPFMKSGDIFFCAIKIKYVFLDPAINNFLGEFRTFCGIFFIAFFLFFWRDRFKKFLRFCPFLQYGITTVHSAVVQMWELEYLVSSEVGSECFFPCFSSFHFLLLPSFSASFLTFSFIVAMVQLSGIEKKFRSFILPFSFVYFLL